MGLTDRAPIDQPETPAQLFERRCGMLVRLREHMRDARKAEECARYTREQYEYRETIELLKRIGPENLAVEYEYGDA